MQGDEQEARILDFRSLLRLSKKLIPSIISFLIFSLHRSIQNDI
jgi:hypothetical protein